MAPEGAVNEILYWSARVLLVVAWLALALLAWRRRAAAGPPWAGVAATALVFASMRAWPYNYLLLEAARCVLRGLGVYDDRLVAKALLAVLLVAAIALAVRALRRARWAGATTICTSAVALQGGLLAIETLSLDDALPSCLFAQPTRYLLEGSFAAMALAAAWSARRSAWTS